jgi:hypothetical protein
MTEPVVQGAGSPTDIWATGGFGGVSVNDVPSRAGH